MCVCQGVRPLHTPPPPPFLLFLGLTAILGKTQACHRAAALVALAPPPPLYGLLLKFFSLFVYLFIYCMQIPCGPCFCSLLGFVVFFIFSGDSLSACAWPPLPHLVRHFMQLGHPTVSFPLLPVGRWTRTKRWWCRHGSGFFWPSHYHHPPASPPSWLADIRISNQSLFYRTE